MLHQINLLPWRAQRQRAQQRRVICLVLFSLLLMMLLQWAAGVYLNNQLERQHQRQIYLTTYSAQLERQLTQLSALERERTQLLSRLASLEGLAAKRSNITRVMNLLATSVPIGAYLERVTLQDSLLELKGFADSSSDLAVLLEALHRAPLVSDVQMHSLVDGKEDLEQHYSTYRISVQLANPRE